MPASDYILNLRRRIGHDLLLLSAIMVALFDDTGRLLLGRRSDNARWGMIGGMTDPGESPADTALREVWEETGLTCELTTLLGVFGGKDHRLTFDNKDEVEPTIILFEGRITGGTILADGAELAEVRFFTLEETATLVLTSSTRVLIEHAFGHKTGFQPARWRPPA